MGFLSDSSYHLKSEQTAFNRQTGKHSPNTACICHSQILNNEVISEWKGNIDKYLSIEYGFPSGTRLMGILRIHLNIYSPECILYSYSVLCVFPSHSICEMCKIILQLCRLQLSIPGRAAVSRNICLLGPSCFGKSKAVFERNYMPR